MTKSEKEHLSKLHQLMHNMSHASRNTPYTLRNGLGQRNSNFNAIPLCANHHRNGGYGIAFHAGRKAFEQKFGTELELLEKVKGLINILTIVYNIINKSVVFNYFKSIVTTSGKQ